MSSDKKASSLSAQGWVDKYWDKDEVPWASDTPTVNSELVKHISALTAGRTNIKILVPFCGDSYDMKWLAEQGHIVVGVEFSEKGVKRFFETYNIEYSVHKVDSVDGVKYESKDGKIKLYACDFYKFSIDVEGTFGAIWDVAAFQAANVEDRQKYMDLIFSVMTEGSRFVLVVMQFGFEFEGPPFKVTYGEVEELCGTKLKLENLGGFEEVFEECGETMITPGITCLLTV